MRLLTFSVVFALSLLFVQPFRLNAQDESGLGIEERAQLFNGLFFGRSILTQDSVPIHTCGLFLALDQEPRFRERLLSWIVKLMPSAESSPCMQEDGGRLSDPGWYFYSLERTTPNMVVVRARVSSSDPPGIRLTSEQYLFCRKDVPRIGVHWMLYTIEISTYGFEDEEFWRVREGACPPPVMRM